MKNAFTGNHKEFTWTPIFADGSSIKLNFPKNSAFFDRSGLLRFFNLRLGNDEIITLSLVHKNQFLNDPGMAWIKQAGIFMTEAIAQQFLDKKKHEDKAIIAAIPHLKQKRYLAAKNR